ncbi:putative heme iron utilization protein [Anoxybacillus eryuanensis]
MLNVEKVRKHWKRYVQFVKQCKTMMISTIDEHGEPFISYAPFVMMEGRYVVGFGQAFDVNLNGERFTHVIVDKSEEGRLEGQ